MKGHKNLKSTFLIAAVIFCAGCGQGGKNTNIDAGMEAIRELEYDAAISCFEAALPAGENKRLLYRGEGISHMGRNDYEAAIDSFRTALSCSNGIPDNIDYDINYYMAAAYYKTGDKAGAVSTYDAILSLRENEKDAYYLRGAVKAEQGRTEEACADFDRAIALDSKNNDRLIDIYCVLENNGYKDIGQEYLQAAIDKEAKDMTNFDKGRISYYLGDYENAKTYLEKARDSSYQAILFLGKTYEILGDYNYAVSVYNAYLEGGNSVPEIYNQLGICKMQMKDYEAALSAFQTAMSIEDNQILQTLRFNEIVAYEFLGEFKKAAVLMDGYLKTYPGDELAVRENIFLETR